MSIVLNFFWEFFPSCGNVIKCRCRGCFETNFAMRSQLFLISRHVCFLADCYMELHFKFIAKESGKFLLSWEFSVGTVTSCFKLNKGCRSQDSNTYIVTFRLWLCSTAAVVISIFKLKKKTFVCCDFTLDWLIDLRVF